MDCRRSRADRQPAEHSCARTGESLPDLEVWTWRGLVTKGTSGPVRRHVRLGGFLNYYVQAALKGPRLTDGTLRANRQWERPSVHQPARRSDSGRRTRRVSGRAERTPNAPPSRLCVPGQHGIHPRNEPMELPYEIAQELLDRGVGDMSLFCNQTRFELDVSLD
jgi:hypothetical protein